MTEKRGTKNGRKSTKEKQNPPPPPPLFSICLCFITFHLFFIMFPLPSLPLTILFLTSSISSYSSSLFSLSSLCYVISLLLLFWNQCHISLLYVNVPNLIPGRDKGLLHVALKRPDEISITETLVI